MLHRGRPYEGTFALVKMLLEAGADPKAADEEGKTPLDLAQDGGKTALAEMLRAHIEEQTVP